MARHESLLRFSASPLLRFCIQCFVFVVLFEVRDALAQGVADRFFPTGVAGGGRLMSVAINPENPSNAFVVCDMSGLFRTHNEGLSWNLIPSDVFTAKEQTSLQFAGSGVNQRIYGIRRLLWGSNKTGPAYTADGGDTWTSIDQPPSPSENDQYYYLFVDPASASAATQRLVVDNYQKLWFSDEGGGSGSWTLIANHPGGISDSFRLAGVFWDGSTIYAGTNVGVYRSTDDGATWSVMSGYGGLPSGAQIVELRGAKHPSSGVVTLFAICVNDDRGAEGWDNARDLDENHTYLGLYSLELTGGSPSWTQRPGPSAEVFVRVDVSTADSTQPWAATSRNLSMPGIFKSTDGGVNWTNTFKTASGGYDDNENVSTGYLGDGGILSWQWSLPGLGIDVSDSDPDRVIVTSDVLHLTDDGGASWMQMYLHPETENPASDPISKPKAYRHSGLGVTTGHWMHWIDPETFLCASTDIGLQITEDAGVSWTTDYTKSDTNGLNPGNWNCVVQKPGAARLYAAVSEINDFYESDRLEDADWVTQLFGDVYYSDDNGQTWASLSAGSSGLPGGEFPGPVVEVAVDSANPNHLYASSSYVSGGGIFHTSDGGATWSKLTNPPRTEGHPLSIRVLGSGQLVATYCARVSGQDGSGLDIYTASSGVFYSSNGGSTWSDRTDSDMEYFTRDLAVNPGDVENWFAAVQSRKINTSGSLPTYDGLGGVYATDDSGVNWVPIFKHNHVVSVTYVNGTTPILYVTTATEGIPGEDEDDEEHLGGLWYSTNPHATTPTFTRLGAFPFARARRVCADPYQTDGTIWVTTQGGGLWRGTVSPSMRPRIVRNGSHYDFEVDVSGDSPTAPTLYGLTDLSGSPSGWSLLTSISPSSSTPAAGITRYTWASVDSDSLFSSVSQGFVRASRERSDGTVEVSDSAGWIFEEIESTHYESWGVSWLRETEHESAVWTLGNTLELASLFSAGYTSGAEYYVEVQEGAAAGHRFDLVESSSSDTSWVIDGSSPHNTTSTVPALNGERVRLRRHLTLEDVFPKSDYTGTNNPATADQVLHYNGAGTGFVGYWRVQVSIYNSWVLVGDSSLVDQSNRVMPPGEGYLVHARASAAATRVARGAGIVRQGLFRQSVLSGTRLHSLGYPVALTPVTNHLQQADGFVSTNNPVTADRFRIWNGDATPGGTSTTDYWFYDATPSPYYAKVGDATLADFNHTLLFPLQRAFFTTVGTAKPNRVVLSPWTP